MPPCQYLRNNISKKSSIAHTKRASFPHICRKFPRFCSSSCRVSRVNMKNVKREKAGAWNHVTLSRECQGTSSRLQTSGRLTFQFGTCCCDRAPDGTGHHSTPLKSRPDPLRLISVSKIRVLSSGTSVLIGWRREEVCALCRSGSGCCRRMSSVTTSPKFFGVGRRSWGVMVTIWN